MLHVGSLNRSIDKFAEQKVALQQEVGAYKANYMPLNRLIDALEEEVDDLEHEVMGLKDQREINHRRLDEKDNIIVGLRDDIAGAERLVARQEDEILAVAIQAAEAEDRADQEKRGRLQLVMRL
jgi:chromosome segregation ATPase